MTPVEQFIAKFDGNLTKRPSVRSNFRFKFNLQGVDYETPWIPNLTTDTASGFTNRRDWQAKSMGNGAAQASVQFSGAATSMSATVLTKSTATFPTAGQGLAGMMVFVGANSSGTGSLVYGRIQSNTATALTVDQWWDPTSSTGAAGTTPNGTAQFIIAVGQATAEMMGLTATATAPTSADTAIASEATTNGFSRAVCAYAHTAAATTYTLIHTFTAGGSLTPAVLGIFSGAISTASGVMPFSTAIPSPPVMLSGDTVAITETVTIG